MFLRFVFFVLCIALAAASAAGAQERPTTKIVPQLGLSNSIGSVAITPDGKTALSGGHDATITLWDLATGHEIGKLTGHSAWINSVAIAPDGKTALSGSNDDTVRLWDLATGREIRKLEADSGEVHSVVYAPDGKTALFGGKGKCESQHKCKGVLKLWDLATGREMRIFEGHSGQVSQIAIAPDGKSVLSVGAVRRYLGPGSTSNGPDEIRFWDLATGRELSKFEGHSSDVRSVAIAPGGKTALFLSGDNTLRLWDVASDREIRTFEGHSDRATSVAIAPDGRTALSVSHDLFGPSELTLWDLASGREIRKLETHSGEVHSVVFSPDGKTALSGGCAEKDPRGSCITGSLKLWDLETGREIRTFEGHLHRVHSVTFSPSGMIALSGGSDDTVRLWDLATGRELRKLEGHWSDVWSVAIAPDGKTALLGGCAEENLRGSCIRGTAELWDLATGRAIRQFEGHLKLITSVAFAPDGKTALSGEICENDHEHSCTGELKLWDLATGRAIRTFEGDLNGRICAARKSAIRQSRSQASGSAGSRHSTALSIRRR
jgi:WD40 repeat protein